MNRQFGEGGLNPKYFLLKTLKYVNQLSYKTFDSFKKFKGLLWKKNFISLQLIRHLVHKIYIDHTITNFIKTTELKNKGKKFIELIYRKGNISQTLSPIVHLTITIQKMIVFIISIIYMCVWAHTHTACEFW